MRARKCILHWARITLTSRCSAPFWAVWYHTLWIFNSPILLYILQVQAWRGQVVSFPPWEHYGWGQTCRVLGGSCRSIRSGVYPLSESVLGVLWVWVLRCNVFRENGACMCNVWLFQWLWNDFYYIKFKFTAGPEKRKRKRSDLSAAAKILLQRTLMFCGRVTGLLYESL